MVDVSLSKRLGILAVPWFLLSAPAFGQWSVNVGYHNPNDARIGINFLYWGARWNGEIGLGWVNGELSSSDDESEEEDAEGKRAKIAASGELDLKYRLVGGAFAPYLQAGFGTSLSASLGARSGAGADLGGPFFGLGLMLGKASIHAYAAYSYQIEQQRTQLQAGLGFDL